MKLLFGNLYKKKIMHFKHHMLFFMVEKTKQMVLLDNCKFFFKKNTVALKAYFCWESFPLPLGYGPGFM